jgi:cyclase
MRPVRTERSTLSTVARTPPANRERNRAKWQYTRGWHDLGNGLWAYLLPDGSWGWSNAGLIVDGDQTLLVDTLFDLKLTAAMLNDMRRSIPAAARIGTLVNTHHNGDHTFGNQLVEGAQIIATNGTSST